MGTHHYIRIFGTSAVVGACLLNAAHSHAGQKTLPKPSASSEKKADTGTSSGKPSNADKPLVHDKKSDQMLGVYVTMMNKESGPVFENRARWTKTFSPEKTGPNCGGQTPMLAFGIEPEYIVKERYAEYRKQLPKQPKLEVDKAALTMLDALQELRAPTEEASKQFRGLQATAEKCQRAKELTSVLLSGWNKYAAADAVLRAYVERYNDERNVSETAAVIKKYGKHYRFYFQTLVTQAKAVVQAADQKPVSPVVVRDKLTMFSQSMSELKAMLEKDRAAGKNEDPFPPSIPLLLEACDSYERATKDFLATLDDPKRSKNEESLRRTHDDVISDYNNFVGAANNTSFEKNQK